MKTYREQYNDLHFSPEEKQAMSRTYWPLCRRRRSECLTKNAFTF